MKLSQVTTSVHLSDTLSKKEFIRAVNKASKERKSSNSGSSCSSSDDSRTEFNKMASECFEDDLKEYVRSFQTKVSLITNSIGRKKIQKVQN